jgi:hypothetical protein
LLKAAGHGWAIRDAIVAALEALPNLINDNINLSSAWIDAMQSLGALEDSANDELESIQSRVLELLKAPDNPDCQAEAWSIFSGRFDHPLAGAYCEV